MPTELNSTGWAVVLRCGPGEGVHSLLTWKQVHREQSRELDTADSQRARDVTRPVVVLDAVISLRKNVRGASALIGAAFSFFFFLSFPPGRLPAT